MAGAGYKLFSTGDVLSASDVNTYLQQQTVMVFASAAARTTALSSVLAEGMVTYLKDTDVVEIYTGAAWVSLDDPNAIQNTLLTAKGSIVTATAASTPSALAVGANNTVLTADSSTATGLKWATPSAGGGWQVVKAETTFTSVASTGTTFDSIFSSSYNYYMVEIKALGGGAAATDDLQLQMLYSGTTQATGYYGTTFGNAHGGTSPASVGTSGATQFTVSPDASGNASTGDRITGLINFYQCHGVSATAAWQGQLLQGYNYANYVFAGQSSTARTYTGFLLKASSGNISGTLTVYGMA